MANPTLRLDSIETLFAKSWQLYKERFVDAIKVLLVPVVIFAVAL